MTRSLYKDPYISSSLLTKIKIKNIYSRSRGSFISPQFVGRTFKIHNGKSFVRLTITEDVIGHKLGEFSSTRKKYVYKRKKKNKK